MGARSRRPAPTHDACGLSSCQGGGGGPRVAAAWAALSPRPSREEWRDWRSSRVGRGAPWQCGTGTGHPWPSARNPVAAGKPLAAGTWRARGGPRRPGPRASKRRQARAPPASAKAQGKKTTNAALRAMPRGAMILRLACMRAPARPPPAAPDADDSPPVFRAACRRPPLSVRGALVEVQPHAWRRQMPCLLVRGHPGTLPRQMPSVQCAMLGFKDAIECDSNNPRNVYYRRVRISTLFADQTGRVTRLTSAMPRTVRAAQEEEPRPAVGLSECPRARTSTRQRSVADGRPRSVSLRGYRAAGSRSHTAKSKAISPVLTQLNVGVRCLLSLMTAY